MDSDSRLHFQVNGFELLYSQGKGLFLDWGKLFPVACEFVAVSCFSLVLLDLHFVTQNIRIANLMFATFSIIFILDSDQYQQKPLVSDRVMVKLDRLNDFIFLVVSFKTYFYQVLFLEPNSIQVSSNFQN